MSDEINIRVFIEPDDDDAAGVSEYDADASTRVSANPSCVACGHNRHYDDSIGACVFNTKADGTCPRDGMTQINTDAGTGCVVDPVLACPAGTVMNDATGKCVPMRHPRGHWHNRPGYNYGPPMMGPAYPPACPFGTMFNPMFNACMPMATPGWSRPGFGYGGPGFGYGGPGYWY